MDLKDTLWELFGKNRDKIGTVELSPIDKVRAMGDHIDFIYITEKRFFVDLMKINLFLQVWVYLIENREIDLMLVYMH